MAHVGAPIRETEMKFGSVIEVLNDDSSVIIFGWLLKFVLVTLAAPAAMVAFVLAAQSLERVWGDGNGLQSFNAEGALIFTVVLVLFSWGLWFYSWMERDVGQVPWIRYVISFLVAITPIGWVMMIFQKST